MSTTGRPCYSSVLRPPWSVRAHLPHPYPIPPPSHPLLCRGREIGGRVLTVSIRCTAESSAFRRASIVDGGSRPLAALRGVGRFIVAGRLPISGKTVGRTGGAIFGFISHYKAGHQAPSELRMQEDEAPIALVHITPHASNNPRKAGPEPKDAEGARKEPEGGR